MAKPPIPKYTRMKEGCNRGERIERCCPGTGSNVARQSYLLRPRIMERFSPHPRITARGYGTGGSRSW